ncbi:hypothetical protein LS482_16185 [Sinomicrobium kalidii]|uniref:hypothetical protein n=1 Tax=Sinomicrobium kalidii TaxID=2900738 RepID=UPI001E5A67A8|nr:hypothetical protein [Sinomicrobium kalidii]UGU15212.1 hypothetical protein LS482_16185 [Sinomicrobium kalidii]
MARIINNFGKIQGWNSITVNLLGRDIEGITAISYSDSEELENVYGAGKYPVGRGGGNYQAEASITLLKEEWDALQAAVPAGQRVQDIAPFDIIVEYTRDNGAIQVDRIRNAQFTGRGVENNQNDKMLEYEAELIISHIEWNV